MAPKPLLYTGRYIALSFLTAFCIFHANAQDVNNAIDQANTMIRSYYDAATRLMYAIGGILAVIGAVRVYQLWGQHHGEAQKAAGAWFGACVFLVLVTSIIRAFFGL